MPKTQTRPSGQRRRSAAYSRGFEDGVASVAQSLASGIASTELLDAARALTSALAQTPEYSAAMARLRAAVESAR